MIAFVQMSRISFPFPHEAKKIDSSAGKQRRMLLIMHLKTYGDKAFSVCAPKLWNLLPLDLRKSPSLTGFKKELKTYLFRQFLERGSLLL